MATFTATLRMAVGAILQEPMTSYEEMDYCVASSKLAGVVERRAHYLPFVVPFGIDHTAN